MKGTKEFADPNTYADTVKTGVDLNKGYMDMNKEFTPKVSSSNGQMAAFANTMTLYSDIDYEDEYEDAKDDLEDLYDAKKDALERAERMAEKALRNKMREAMAAAELKEDK